MVSYVVTGANRGIGLALVQALYARCTRDPSNGLQEHNPEDLILAIVRDPSSCDELKKLAGPNVHIILGDLDKPETLHVGIARCLSSEMHAN
jgi:NAD(P)-dependent dehydrogenase (short-subunit alcohol dehydrogenase family)